MSGPFANIRQKNPQLADDLAVLQAELKKNGAPSASRRLEMVDDQLDRLNPDTVYQWVDPSRVFGELEDVRGTWARWARRLSGARNVLALGPLVLTWIALSWAAGQYQQQIAAALNPPQGQPPDLVTANTPFLVLWQEGFGHPTFFTFSHTAFLDFLLLSVLLLLTFGAQRLDAVAHHKAVELVGQVDEAIAPLAKLAGSTQIPANANPNDWARVVQNVITTMTNEVKQTAQQATTVVQQVGQSTNDLILKEMKPLVAGFQTSVTNLDTSLKSVATIGTTVTNLGVAAQKVADASTTLANSFSQYQQTAASIAKNVGDLSTNQKVLATQSSQLAGTLTTATQTTGAMAQQLKGTADKYESFANQLDVTANTLGNVSDGLDKASRRLKNAIPRVKPRPGLFGWLGI